MAENRLPRELEKREQTERTPAWRQPEALPKVDVGEGWVARWVRVSSMGNPDTTNISSKLRQGWVPCKAEDHPEVFSDSVVDPRFKDNIIIGGLMLCKAPQELADERNAFYREQTRSQMTSVNKNLMRENDPRMPLFNEQSTKVSPFGHG